MSTVDDRIVRLQFDNAQFEAGVMRSMKTLDELNEKLQFKDAAKGASALQVALAGIEGVSDSVLESAFSGLDRLAKYSTTIVGKIADSIKTDIANAITGAIRSITSIPDLALNQIKSGGWSRASNIADAQFRIEGLGYAWEDVKKAADYAVQDTAYGLDAAAKAASQLAASGIDFQKVIEHTGDTDLTQMHKALRGISGVAAMTNSSFDEIANIFTKVAGIGTLHATELNSISIRGINAAATLAKYLGVTEDDIHEMTKKNLIDFETFAYAMDDAFGEHAKEANKTFVGSLSNMKAALSRIGAIFAQPVIDKTNTLFIAVTTRIKEFQKALNDASNEDGSKIARFATHFAEAWESGIAAASAFVYSLDLSWFENIGSFLDKVAIRMKTVFDGLTNYFSKIKGGVASATGAIGDSLELDLQDLDLLHRILENEFGFVEERWGKLDKIYEEQGSPKTGLWLQGYMDQLAKVGYNFETLGWTEEELTKKFEEQAKELSMQEVLFASIGTAVEGIKTAIGGAKAVIKGFISGLASIGRGIGESFLSIAKGFSEGFLVNNISETFGKFSGSFKNFAESLRPSVSLMELMRGAASKVAESLSGMIVKIIEAGGTIFTFASDVISGRRSLKELIEQADLTPVENFAIGFIRIFTNFKTIVSNAMSSIMKLIKSFKNAFVNVFRSDLVTNGVAKFTDTVADLSDMFKISDETATKFQEAFEAILGVFSKLGGVVTKVFSKISSFFSKSKGLGAFGATTSEAAKEVVELSKDVVDVSVNAEKAEGIFYRLKIIFNNVLDSIKKVPSKLKELWEAIKQSEGVEHLKKSFENLKKAISDMFTKEIDPAKQALEAFGATADDTGEETESKLVTAISMVSDAISLVVDGLTWLFEKLPEWKKQIEDFFKTMETGFLLVYNTITEKLTGAGKAIGFDTLMADIKEIWDGVGEDEQTLGEHIGAFIETAFKSITDSINNIDWDSVGKISLLTLAGASLYKFFGIMSGLEDFTRNIADIPKGVTGVFKSLSEIFKMATKSVGRMTTAMMFMTYAASVVMIAGALVLIADLPWEKTKDALSVITIITILFLAIGKMVNKSNEAAKKLPSIFQKSTNTFAQIQMQIPKLLGLAAVILSITFFFKTLIGAINELAPIMDIVSDEGLKNMLIAMAAISITLLVMVSIIGVILLTITHFQVKMDNDRTNVFDEKKMFAGLVSVALLIAAIGAGVYLIVKAMDVFDGLTITPWGIVAILGTLAALSAVAILAVKFAKGVNHKALISAALLVAIMAGTIWVIMLQITTLAAAIALAEKTGNGEAMALSIATVLGSIVAVGFAINLLISSLKGLKPEAVKEVKLILLEVVGFVLALGFSIAMMANAFSNADSAPMAMGGIIVSMVAMGVIIAGLVHVAKQLQAISDIKKLIVTFAGLTAVILALGFSVFLMAAAFSDSSNLGNAFGGVVLGILFFGLVAKMVTDMVKDFKSIPTDTIVSTMGMLAVALIAMAASILIIAAAASVMSSASLPGVAATLFTMFGLLGVLALIVKMLSKDSVDHKKLDNIVTFMLSIGAVMIMMGAAALLIAKACETMNGIKASTYLAVIAPLGAMMLLFLGIVAALTFIKGGAFGKGAVEIIKGVAEGFLTFSLSLVAMSLAVLLLGVGTGVLAGGLGKLAEGLATFAVTFEEHTSAIVLLIVLIGIVAVVIGILMSKLLSFSSIATSVADKVKKKTEESGSKFHDVYEAIKKKLSEAPDKLKKRWKEFTPKAKIAIATGIVTIIGGLAAATPEALAHIGEIIFTVLKWVIGLVPKLIDILVELLITILNGLAEVIRTKAARIVAAVYNLLEAVMEIIVHVFASVFAATIGGFLSAIGLDSVAESVGPWLAKGSAAVVKSMRKGQEAVDTYAYSVNSLIGETEELNKMNEETVKTAKKNISTYEKLSDAYNDTSKGTDVVSKSLNMLSKSKDLDEEKLKTEQKKIKTEEDYAKALHKTTAEIEKEKYEQAQLNTEQEKDGSIFDTLQDKWDGVKETGSEVLSGLGEGLVATSPVGQALSSASIFGGDTDMSLNIDDVVDTSSLIDESGEFGFSAGDEFTTEYADTVSSDTAKEEAYVSTAELVAESKRAVDDMKPKVEEASYATNVRGVTNPMYANSQKYYDAGYNGQEMIEKGKAQARADYSNDNIKAAKDDGHSYWVAFNSKDGIDANSPSKKFYKSGLWCILGVQQAIKDNAYLATGQVETLGDTMVDSIGESMDYVAKIASGEIEYDPRVRPVLDTSGIGRGAGDITSMFAHQNVSLAGLSGQIAYDMTNLNGSNAAVVAELQALREDMNYMTEEMANMQIVMDTGALVGSTVGAYDEAFGRLANYGERGN